MNKVLLLGNVGKDPEIRSTQSGDKIANFSLATSEKWKDKNTGQKQEKTEWHRIVVFGPLASIIENYAPKGTKLLVEGKLQTRKWTDQSGQDRFSTEVVVSGFGANIQLLSQRQEGQGTSTPPLAEYNSYDAGLDDEIPF